jgi:hypothetical protein
MKERTEGLHPGITSFLGENFEPGGQILPRVEVETWPVCLRETGETKNFGFCECIIMSTINGWKNESKVARFFLLHDTKTGKKCTK